MNRQQFGVELSQYLTFVSPDQREQIVAYYDSLLAEAGPEGEFDLFKQIGTPMTVAIAMKRHLEANEPLLPEGAEEELAKKAPAMVKFEQPESIEALGDAPAPQVARPLDEPVPEPAEEAPAEEPKIIPAESDEAPAEDSVAEEPAAAPTEDTSEEAPAPESVETAPLESAPKEPEIQAADTPVYEKPKMTFGRFLEAIGIGILSVCIIAFFCFVAAIGGVIIVSGVELVISCFGISGYLTDSLMVGGCGVAIFGIGLLLAWLCIWAAIRLIVDMIRSFNKKPSLGKSALTTIWSIVGILVIVLVVLGIICAGAALLMGGSVDTLTESQAFAKFITRVTPSTYVDFIISASIFG